jgi:hypothetical protein
LDDNDEDSIDLSIMLEDWILSRSSCKKEVL